MSLSCEAKGITKLILLEYKSPHISVNILALFPPLSKNLCYNHASETGLHFSLAQSAINYNRLRHARNVTACYLVLELPLVGSAPQQVSICLKAYAIMKHRFCQISHDNSQFLWPVSQSVHLQIIPSESAHHSRFSCL